jgi:hypothetical protein
MLSLWATWKADRRQEQAGGRCYYEEWTHGAIPCATKTTEKTLLPDQRVDNYHWMDDSGDLFPDSAEQRSILGILWESKKG